jgi:ATP-dependent DNA helicase PIF1
MDINY